VLVVICIHLVLLWFCRTRILVELILEKLAGDPLFEELAGAYPCISPADTQACLFFAADNTKHEKTLAIA